MLCIKMSLGLYECVKMCTTIFMITVLITILSLVSLVKGNEESRMFAEKVHHPAIARVVKMRCTRRFSPGVCVDEVVPVWTFVFLAQNCTERLGCPNNYRTNRFRSYRMCMRQCRALVNMYLKMVEYEEHNGTYSEEVAIDAEASDKEGKNEADDFNLREGLTQYYIAGAKDKKQFLNLNMDFEDESYKEGEQETHFIVYKDGNVNEDIQPPDVDYVPGEIRSEFDLLGW